MNNEARIGKYIQTALLFDIPVFLIEMEGENLLSCLK